MPFAMGDLRSPRYLATIFSDTGTDFPTSVMSTAVPCPLPSNVSNLSSILVAHEVDLTFHVIEPDGVDHRITLRINCPQPQRSLRSGEKNVDLGLFHAGSIRHRLMHPHH
jgi:hypothetical protein